MKTPQEIRERITTLDREILAEPNPTLRTHRESARKAWRSALFYSTEGIAMARQSNRAKFFLSGAVGLRSFGN